MRATKLVAAVGAAGLIAGSGGVPAATDTTTFRVTANVPAQCRVTATDLAFGAVDPLGGDVDQTSSISVRCTKNTTYTVGMDAGVTAGATIAQRKMANGPDTMNYNLYLDAGRSSVWGTAAGSVAVGTGTGMGNTLTHTVYGRVPTGQTNLAVGNYQENTITVTVTY